MKSPILPLGLLLLLAAGIVSLASAADPKDSGTDAQKLASEWLERLGEKGLVLDKALEDHGFTVTHANSAVGRITKFQFQQPGWWLSFSFRGELSPDTPIKTLEKKFWHVSLNQLPTPGLDLPGWEVRPQTPTSSFEEGFEILSYGDGKIKIRIRTDFFALYGRDPSILVPADAPSPPGSYFQIRKKFPLDLTLEAPFTFP